MEYLQQVKFLLVEDDDAHASLIMYAFNESNILNEVDRLVNGNDVMKYLKQEEKYKDKSLPHIILLDLNIPGKDGLEVLQEIKQDEELKHIPVVILTTSRSLSDRKNAYMKYANSYLVKPVDFDKFHQMIKEIGLYWSVWNIPSHDD